MASKFSLPPMRRVVVTGIGVVCPLGNTLATSWSALLAGQGGMTSLEEALVQHQNLTEDQLERELAMAKTLPAQVVAPVRDLGSDNRTGRFVKMALEAGAEAMQNSNLLTWLKEQDNDECYDNIGVCIGSGMSGVREVTTALHTVEKRSLNKLTPHFIPKVLSNSAAGRLSVEYGLRGPNHSASTACAAGSHAIGDAMRCIQYGNADVMLAGGAEASIDPLSLAGFCRLRALSTGFAPEEASRPFDCGRDGFVMGEGSAVLVLEGLDHAQARGAPILAELVGYGLSGDGFHITAPDSEGRGAERAMRLALQQAGSDGSEVGYVNAHATSTPKGDEIEGNVIGRVLSSSNAENPLYVSSTKGATGHLLGAAGALEAAFTVMSLVDQTVPPTKNLTDIDGTYDFEHVLGSALPTKLSGAMSNSFGFGGTNASLYFKVFEE